MTRIPAEKCGCDITAEERERLLVLLKSLRFNIKSPLPLTSAMVTAAGFRSKKSTRKRWVETGQSLFFGGEVMDIDAETGGYNLQAAFSTGYLAGKAQQCTLVKMRNLYK